MKIVLQRVSQASVKAEGRTVGTIGRGVCLLVGVEKGDGEHEADYLANKITGLRIFPDETGRMNLSLLDNAWLDLSMLVSNFLTWTLSAWLVSSRVYAGIAMLKRGRDYPVNLYKLSEVRPFGRMAILDLLFAMGIIK